MRTKMFAITVTTMALIAGGTALAFGLMGNKAQADTTPAAVTPTDEAAGCCVTGDCCCPGQGDCCGPAARAKAKTANAKTTTNCCVTGNCCCPGQGSCCATASDNTKTEAKACCAAKTEKKSDCCEK